MSVVKDTGEDAEDRVHAEASAKHFAAEFGFDRVREIPIRLDYRFSGTGINVPAIKRMFMDTLAEDYVQTARAKGLRDGHILRAHALPNAMLPAVTIVAIQLG